MRFVLRFPAGRKKEDNKNFTLKIRTVLLLPKTAPLFLLPYRTIILPFSSFLNWKPRQVCQLSTFSLYFGFLFLEVDNSKLGGYHSGRLSFLPLRHFLFLFKRAFAQGSRILTVIYNFCFLQCTRVTATRFVGSIPCKFGPLRLWDFKDSKNSRLCFFCISP